MSPAWHGRTIVGDGRATERLVIVGELNPYGSLPRFALYGLPRAASGNRLREHLGLRDRTYAELHKVNLCEGKWSMAQAIERRELLYTMPYEVFVLLGAKVRGAFGGPPFFEAMKLVKGALVTLPHPSGLNRMWNVPGARKRARALLSEHAPWVPWGEVTFGERFGPAARRLDPV